MSSVPRSADLQFSIVVVARDEAIALPQLCYQLEDFIEREGELLVTDTGSTDDTVAIAKHRGCRVELVGERYAALLTPEQAAAITERFARNPPLIHCTCSAASPSSSYSSTPAQSLASSPP